MVKKNLSIKIKEWIISTRLEKAYTKQEVITMYFNTVSLNSIMEFTFMQDDIINIPLEFHIIDDGNNYLVFED